MKGHQAGQGLEHLLYKKIIKELGLSNLEEERLGEG